MSPTTGDERDRRQREAVRSEMQRQRAADEREERDPVEAVGEEQRRERDPVDEDADADADD
jgi:hypothetical protein